MVGGDDVALDISQSPVVAPPSPTEPGKTKRKRTQSKQSSSNGGGVDVLTKTAEVSPVLNKDLSDQDSDSLVLWR